MLNRLVGTLGVRTDFFSRSVSQNFAAESIEPGRRQAVFFVSLEVFNSGCSFIPTHANNGNRLEAVALVLIDRLYHL